MPVPLLDAMVMPMTTLPTLTPLRLVASTTSASPSAPKDKEFDAVNRWYRGPPVGHGCEVWRHRPRCRREATDERLGARRAGAVVGLPAALRRLQEHHAQTSSGRPPTPTNCSSPSWMASPPAGGADAGLPVRLRLHRPWRPARVRRVLRRPHRPKPRRTPRRARCVNPGACRSRAAHAHRPLISRRPNRRPRCSARDGGAGAAPDRIPGLSRTWSGTTGPRFSLPGALDLVILATLCCRTSGWKTFFQSGWNRSFSASAMAFLAPSEK